ncbi:MAG: hypothetical protein AB7O59_23350 [Pirellulales bacterium]
MASPSSPSPHKPAHEALRRELLKRIVERESLRRKPRDTSVK